MGTELFLMSPLILISFVAISAIVIDALFQKEKGIGYGYALSGLIVVCAASVLTLMRMPSVIYPHADEFVISKGMLVFGGYSAIFDIIFCVAGILTVLASRPYLQREYKEHNEYYSLLLFSISGMMLIGHANNLLILFIGIEVMSIAFYVLSGFFRTNIGSVEASLKYFLLGAFATGFLVYGIALVYGATGSIEVVQISHFILYVSNPPMYLMIGIGLIIVGLGFKIAAFPFHQWAPDVYQGAPTVVTGFMSTAGKAAGMVAFIVVARSFIPIFYSNDVKFDAEGVRIVLAVLSALTMLYGNIVALAQKNVKRMLAYSSIAHAGYMLMGIVAKTPHGWDAIVFYIITYLFMQLGAFVVISKVENKGENLELSDFTGLGKTKPILAAMMAVFMFSLAGIPPFAGFFGKYYLFVAAIETGYLWLTIIAVIASVISIYFYIGLIVQMYFKEAPEKEIETKTGGETITLVISLVALFVFGIFPSLLLNMIHKGFMIYLKF